jgi:hypothetical protein
MTVWTNIWMARAGCQSMRVSSLEAASTPVVALSRRWIVATSRVGAVMRVAGASCLVTRDVASADAQNKMSSKSGKDIVEGREKV